jgi:lipoprotein-anchoring transpeptidase ErfK/SrfK
VRGEPRKNVVSRVEVDKPGRRLRAFDEAGALVAVYPASIGSEEKPAPSGTHHVRAVAKNPTYTYNPDFKFKGVKAKKPFEVPPGPNNPVGVVWIDLSVETYGIHGAPEPERVGKAFSNGCVRLTNWDALDLAAMLRRKAQVAFSD